MRLSANFTYEEMIKSTTAKRKGIVNIPNETEEANLRKLCNNILQPIRETYGKPIVVSSGYRCKELNKAVGGVTTSDHVNGNAADIHTISDLPQDNKELFDIIQTMIKDKRIEVGQLIDEYNYNWIHISNPTNKHHNQTLHIK